MIEKKIITRIKKNGICLIENFYSPNECKKLVKVSEELFANLKKKGENFQNFVK